jgi:hypothetical protein
MSHHQPGAPFGLNRRTLLGGAGALAAAGLGARLGAVAAQDATPVATAFPMAGHPVIGVWQWADPSDPSHIYAYAIFSDVGGYVEGIWRFRGPLLLPMGTWRATGERTADLVFAQQPIVARDLFDPTQLLQGNALAAGFADMTVWRLSLTVDETGTTLTQTGGFDAFDGEGTVIYSQDFDGIGTRMAPVPTAAEFTPTP